MAKIINPILNRRFFESTQHRFVTMFQPIQATESKESDVLAFIATPVIDYVVLDGLYALDISIHILNATASLLKAAYLWTLNQQGTDELFDKETEKELDDFIDNIDQIINLTVAQFFNLVFSTLSLVTRPVISVLEAICEDELEAANEGRQYSL